MAKEYKQMYRPKSPFNAQFELLKPITKTVKASPKKTYENAGKFYGSFKTFGGTESTSNGLTVVENTAVIECWYTPEIKSDCKIKNGTKEYEILGEPENIEMRNQFLKFKVREVKGGA